MLSIPAHLIGNISWMRNFPIRNGPCGWCQVVMEAGQVSFGELGTLKRQDFHIVDICVQGLCLRCHMTALGFVSWVCA